MVNRWLHLAVPYSNPLCGTAVDLETWGKLSVDEQAFSRPYLVYYKSRAHVIFNASASHHELHKLDRRLGLISGASARSIGICAYSNLMGCDGERTCFDGGAIFADGGGIISRGERFFLSEVNTPHEISHKARVLCQR